MSKNGERTPERLWLAYERSEELRKAFNAIFKHINSHEKQRRADQDPTVPSEVNTIILESEKRDGVYYSKELVGKIYSNAYRHIGSKDLIEEIEAPKMGEVCLQETMLVEGEEQILSIHGFELCKYMGGLLVKPLNGTNSELLDEMTDELSSIAYFNGSLSSDTL